MHLSPESPKLLFMITKVLIIGAGAIAHLHAKAALKLNPVPKIAAANPDAASRDSFFTAFPGSLMFESAETMLAEPSGGTEVVIVATPPFLHCEHGLAGLRSGRHVLVEKPTALNPAEAEALASEARALGLELVLQFAVFGASDHGGDSSSFGNRGARQRLAGAVASTGERRHQRSQLPAAVAMVSGSQQSGRRDFIRLGMLRSRGVV